MLKASPRRLAPVGRIGHRVTTHLSFVAERGDMSTIPSGYWVAVHPGGVAYTYSPRVAGVECIRLRAGRRTCQNKTNHEIESVTQVSCGHLTSLKGIHDVRASKRAVSLVPLISIYPATFSSCGAKKISLSNSSAPTTMALSATLKAGQWCEPM